MTERRAVGGGRQKEKGAPHVRYGVYVMWKCLLIKMEFDFEDSMAPAAVEKRGKNFSLVTWWFDFEGRATDIDCILENDGNVGTLYLTNFLEITKYKILLKM